MKQKKYLLEQLDRPILAIQSIEASYGQILILTDSAKLYGFDIQKNQLQYLSSIQLPVLGEDKDHYFGAPTYKLYASQNGLYAAVVVDHGQFANVFNISSGETILQIDAKQYYEYTVGFSFAFSRYNNDDICIFRTDWNRLDAYNLTQNTLMTQRHIDAYKDQLPLHYLDYFHGNLYVSPNHQRILDDGWVWQPVNIPRIWSLPDWFSKNPYESEDGHSLRQLSYRDDWNYPMCWLTDTTIALWHTLIWDMEQYESVESDNSQGYGVRLYSLVEIDEGSVWAMPEQTQKVMALFADQKLLIIVGNENISFYSTTKFSKLAEFPNQRAQVQHSSSHCLFAFQEKTLLSLDYSDLI
ncbi:hypothetical protein ACG9Y7_09820 [Acinetobacter gerneri]|uniref:hypothetical protein n=1 Tax=Acinetobacter gerneri TaxID=202952 RepID=UPI003AF56856